MITTLTTCDLCPATAPTERGLESGFSRLVLSGEGPAKFRPVIADTAVHLDLCPDCFKAFMGWAAQRKPKPKVVDDNAPVEAGAYASDHVDVRPYESDPEPVLLPEPSPAPHHDDTPSETAP